MDICRCSGSLLCVFWPPGWARGVRTCYPAGGRDFAAFFPEQSPSEVLPAYPGEAVKGGTGLCEKFGAERTNRQEHAHAGIIQIKFCGVGLY